jgi:hypothetical protein
MNVGNFARADAYVFLHAEKSIITDIAEIVKE